MSVCVCMCGSGEGVEVEGIDSAELNNIYLQQS